MLSKWQPLTFPEIKFAYSTKLWGAVLPVGRLIWLVSVDTPSSWRSPRESNKLDRDLDLGIQYLPFTWWVFPGMNLSKGLWCIHPQCDRKCHHVETQSYKTFPSNFCIWILKFYMLSIANRVTKSFVRLTC